VWHNKLSMWIAPLTINGQSQSVYFEVGALLQYSVPNSGEIVSSEQYQSTVIGKLSI
jgi:hypothetical protein